MFNEDEKSYFILFVDFEMILMKLKMKCEFNYI